MMMTRWGGWFCSFEWQPFVLTWFQQEWVSILMRMELGMFRFDHDLFNHFKTGLLYPLPLIFIQPGNPSTETCSLMYRFIPPCLKLSCPSSHSWSSESCGDAVVLKQLAFSSCETNPTEGNLRSFHKARNKCVYSQESQKTCFQSQE